MSSFNQSDTKHFLNLLKDTHSWPCEYTFKFIGEKNDIKNVVLLFSNLADVKIRESKKGNYNSLTIVQKISSPEEVINMYNNVYDKHPKLIKL